MHSSRMRTGRSLPYKGVSVQGVSLSRGGLCSGWGSLSRGYLSGGSLSGAGSLSRRPPVNRMTYRCKNITLPKTCTDSMNTCIGILNYKLQQPAFLQPRRWLIKYADNLVHELAVSIQIFYRSVSSISLKSVYFKHCLRRAV